MVKKNSRILSPFEAAVSIRPVNAFHFGNWLRATIDATGETYKAFASRVPVSEVTLHSWMKHERPPVTGPKAGKLAKAVGTTKDTIDFLLKAASQGMSETAVKDAIDTLHKMSEVIAEVRQEERKFGHEFTLEYLMTVAGVKTPEALNKMLLSMRQNKKDYFGADSVPYFDRDLAAGPWAEPVEIDNHSADGRLPAPPLPVGKNMDKVFAVRLSGSSMEPRYPSESFVYFYSIYPKTQPPVVGHDYYIHRQDGLATFKTVVGYRDGGATIRLKARNQSDLPGHLDVPYEQIVNAAEAVGVYRDCDWSKLIDLDEQADIRSEQEFDRRVKALKRRVR
jgi:phage repressor protein C with HTH and peptisase S24 domain